MSEVLDGYFEDLKEKVDLAYEVASKAREIGLDLKDEVECPLALTMAERAVNLVRTVYDIDVSKISSRILELEEKYGKLDLAVSFDIAREIGEGKFGKLGSELERIDCGIRVGFAYMTLGVVASPIEGYTGLQIRRSQVAGRRSQDIPHKIGDSSSPTISRGNFGNQKFGSKNKEEDKGYFVANFSGPIRSAGTTAVCLCLFLIDYMREVFGYDRFEATNEEVERYVVEIRDFHEKVANLAYFPTEEEARFLARNLSFQLGGDPTEKIEVREFKNLDRVPTNRIRGGMCLAFGEALALKIGKAYGRLKSSGVDWKGWDWVEEYLEIHKKRESGRGSVEATYIKDLVAGRPVYGHPGRSGGFRFRYGRSRTSGFSGVSISSAAMGVTGGFLSNGTQLRLEKPMKACVITSCDSIEGPIVKLKNGSVRKVLDYEEGLRLHKEGEIEEILYLGDILVSIGDVIDRNSDLIRSGFVEEWWKDILKDFSIKNQGVFDSLDFSWKKEKFNLEEVVEISEKCKIPLHPNFIFYWSQVSREEFFGLIRWLNSGIWRGDKLVLNWEASKREEFAFGKRALEVLGVSHEVVMDNVVVSDDAMSFLFNLGKEEVYNGEVLEFKINETDERGVLEIVNDWCRFEIKDKWGTGIGARMGRPEKAKARELVGSPNVLFPVGDSGGRQKSLLEASESGGVKSSWPVYECGCKKLGISNIPHKAEGSLTHSSSRGSLGESERFDGFGISKNCVFCGKTAKKMKFCRSCNKSFEEKCEFGHEVEDFRIGRVDIKPYFEKAVLDLGLEKHEVLGLVKGVNVLNSEKRVPENLAKGILRAKWDLSVNKDGTIRYDATEIPLTHFKASEIGVSVEKLRGLGYLKDVFGKDLEKEDQILELMPHDVVLPDLAELGSERVSEWMRRVASFVDEELVRFYGLEKFYDLKGKDDLIGESVVCIAPHNCAGVVGRIIGWTKMQGLLMSPFMHAALRRDCDGDEASVMLLMDVLLNFSKDFLPGHRGGRQDAPLVLNARIREGEVDDQVLFFDTLDKYPLELYEMADKGFHSSSVRENIELVGDKLRRGKSGFVLNGFTRDTPDFNFGNNNGVYKTIPTMKEKVDAQMELAEKLRSVDENDVARLVLERHFIRDIRGNLRKFSRQSFRCSSCNEKYRRPPLSGVCFKCSGKLIFTVSEGSVRKYMEPAMELASKYEVGGYTREVLELIGDYVERIFGKGEKQERL